MKLVLTSREIQPARRDNCSSTCITDASSLGRPCVSAAIVYIILGLVSSFHAASLPACCFRGSAVRQVTDVFVLFCSVRQSCFLYITIVVLVLVPSGPATFDLYTVA